LIAAVTGHARCPKATVSEVASAAHAVRTADAGTLVSVSLMKVVMALDTVAGER
jgi:hypothetical protein